MPATLIPAAHALALLGAALLAAAGAGCGEAEPPRDMGADRASDDLPPVTANLELGGAEYDGSGFLPFEGDHVLAPGSQGGFHIWLKLRLRDVPPGLVLVAREARRVSDDKLLLNAPRTPLEVGEADADGWWETPDAIPSFMCPTPLGVNVIDERVRFVVVVSSEDGRELARQVGEVTARCPTDAQEEFCRRICSG